VLRLLLQLHAGRARSTQHRLSQAHSHLLLLLLLLLLGWGAVDRLQLGAHGHGGEGHPPTAHLLLVVHLLLLLLLLAHLVELQLLQLLLHGVGRWKPVCLPDAGCTQVGLHNTSSSRKGASVQHLLQGKVRLEDIRVGVSAPQQLLLTHTATPPPAPDEVEAPNDSISDSWPCQDW
jgi:hypothetical protein